jgi:hypothetical protein
MEWRFCISWLLKEAAFSLYFSLLTGIFGRDGFAADCDHRQTVCSSENCSLISRKFAAFRGFLLIGLARSGHSAARHCPIFPLFLYGPSWQSPFTLHPRWKRIGFLELALVPIRIGHGHHARLIQLLDLIRPLRDPATATACDLSLQ